jgi:plastocyanin
MKLKLCIVSLLFLVFCGCETPGSTTVDSSGNIVPVPTPIPSLPAPVTVQIPENAIGLGQAAFGVYPLTIPVGTSVTWVNNDHVEHTATEIPAEFASFDSGFIQPGASWTYTFLTTGTFDYEDSVYGSEEMSGQIVVQ